MNSKVMKRGATEESLAEDRPEKRPAVAVDSAQSSFHGHGLQNSGRGNITVGRDLTIGSWSDNRFDCQRDLFVTNPAEDRKALERKKGGHAPGTCGWILHTTELTAWLGSGPTGTIGPERQAAQVLWLHGNPGTGKSTMTIYLTEELPKTYLNTNGEMLAYFFCDSGFDKQMTATSILRGLIHQLVGQHEQLLDYLLPDYHKRGAEIFKSFDALWEIFTAMAADQNTGRKYCIIDALNECDRESQNTLLAQLEETFLSQGISPNIRILITSRPYSEIRESLQRFPNMDLASFPERQKDIDLCIEEKVNHLAKRKCYTDKVKVQISKILRDKAEGTFLWIGLACEELKHISSSRAISVLQSIPKGLDLLYEELLGAALQQNETSCDGIRRLLSCVVVCSRPLTVPEFSEACQLYQEEEDVETRLQFTREYIESCRLMIIIQAEEVLLLHKSVKDYLIRTCFIQKLGSHAQLAYRCVDVLVEQFCSVKQPQNSFLEYALLGWAEHARMAESSFKVQNPQAVFFQIDSSCRERWLMHVRSRQRFFKVPQSFSIFHIAAEWGIPALVDYASALVAQKVNTENSTHVVHINCEDDSGRMPLECAVRSRYSDAITALLRQGGVVTTQVVAAAAANSWGGEVMFLLLDGCGDQITITDRVLKAVAGNRTQGERVMRLVLGRYGDQLTITNKVLEAAAGNLGGAEVMELLLEYCGDQVTITNEVLRAAAGNSGGREVMELLLDRCASQITINDEVLKAAAGNLGGGKVLQLLFDRCGDQITITNEVLKATAGLSWGSKAMALLLDHSRDQITITEELVKAAAASPAGKEIMELILDRYGDQIIITNEVLKVAAQSKQGKEVMGLLLDRCGDQIARPHDKYFKGVYIPPTEWPSRAEDQFLATLERLSALNS